MGILGDKTRLPFPHKFEDFYTKIERMLTLSVQDELDIVHVDGTNGNDSKNGRDWDNAKATIQAGLNLARRLGDGATLDTAKNRNKYVLVWPGQYNEQVVFSGYNIHLIGMWPLTTNGDYGVVVNYNAAVATNYVFAFTGAGLEVANICFNCTAAIPIALIGSSPNVGDAVHIHDCWFKGDNSKTVTIGISGNIKNSIIENNWFNGMITGIDIANGDWFNRTTVRNNRFTNVTNGIAIANGAVPTESEICYNLVDGSSTSIVNGQATDILIHNNVVSVDITDAGSKTANNTLLVSHSGTDIESKVDDVLTILGGAATQLRTTQSISGAVEEDGIVSFFLGLMDIDTGAVSSANIDITGISATLEKSTGGGAFSTGGITQPTFSKANGYVEVDYRFLAAEWANGDMYKLTVTGITCTVGGDTAYVPAMVWSGLLGEFANVETKIDGIVTVTNNIQTDLGNPSARTNFQDIENMIGIPDAANSNLNDILNTGFDSSAIASNVDGSVLERLEQIKDSIVFVNADIGNPSARTNNDDIESMIGVPDAANSNLDDMLRTGFNSSAITANVDGSIMERQEDIKDRVAAIQTDLGDPSSRANLQTLQAMLGNPDTAGASIYGNIGNFVAQANLQTLLAALGIPDVAGKPLYTCLITDRLDNGTYGLNALKTEIDANETKIDGVVTDIGDPSGHTLISLTAKFGDDASTVKQRFDTVDTATTAIETDIGDPSGHNLTSLTAKWGDDTNTLKTRLDTIDAANTAINTDIGNPSARTNFQDIENMIGIPDAANSNLNDMLNTGFDSSAITAGADGSVMERQEYIQTNIGAFSAQANLQTLLAVLGVPDVAGKPLYTCLVTDRLDNGTYGLNALKTEIDANETKIDAIQTDLGNPSVRTNFQTIEAMIDVPDAANSNLNDILNTGFDSSAISANVDGSVLERLEDINAKTTGTTTTATYAYLAAGGTQDIVEVVSSTRKLVKGILVDCNTLTQNGTLGFMVKVDGTNYREVSTAAFTVASDDSIYLAVDMIVDDDFKFTWLAGGAEGSDRNLPYMLSYQSLE